MEVQKSDPVCGKYKTTIWTLFDSDIIKFCRFKLASLEFCSWEDANIVLMSCWMWGDSNPVIRDIYYRQLTEVE